MKTIVVHRFDPLDHAIVIEHFSASLAPGLAEPGAQLGAVGESLDRQLQTGYVLRREQYARGGIDHLARAVHVEADRGPPGEHRLGKRPRQTLAKRAMNQHVRRVHDGEVFIQPEIASRTLRVALHSPGDLVEPLSEREREVLVMLAQGIPNKEIADKLHIAEGTVKNHVSNILGKLQAQNRTEAADIARRRGLI